jgi:aspartate kinase
MKFGGTSLEDGQAFERVAHIVGSNPDENLVVVVSAMSGVTDALISSFQRAAKGETSEALQTLDYHFERHLKAASISGTSATESMRVVIEQSRREVIALLHDVCANRRTTAEGQDAMVSQGERLSANLLTIVLNGYGIQAAYADARRCILTNSDHGNAKPLIEETGRQTRAELRPLLQTKRLPVLGGFIAATKNCVTTTLGRGSSDYSATLISAALGAREIQIWTDVDGVMSADPCLVKSARTVSQLSYQEAAELARLGARVLHSKMIEPVIQQKIPIRILNSRIPEQRGTVICSGSQTTTSTVKAIAHKTNLSRIEITSTPSFVANGFLRAIRNIFDRHHTEMDIVSKSEVGVSLACEEDGAVPSLIQDLQRVGSVETMGQRAIISCVGEGLQSEDHSRKLRRKLWEIEPTLTWHSSSDLNLISTIDADSVGPIVNRIHQGLLSEPFKSRS